MSYGVLLEKSKWTKREIWLAMDRKTKEIIGIYTGDRSRESTKQLWNILPTIYRQCAVIYTNKWKAYQGILPSKRHRIINKGKRETQHLEKFNHTLRQRVSRLARKTLSWFLRKFNHIGAILCFIDCYLFTI